MYNPQNNTWGFSVTGSNGLFDGVAASPITFGRGSDTTPNWFFHLKAAGNIGLLDIYAIAKICMGTQVYPAGELISEDDFPAFVQTSKSTRNILTPFLLHRVSIITVAGGTPTLRLRKTVSGVDQNSGITTVVQEPVASFALTAITAPLFITNTGCKIITPGDVLVVNNTGGVAGLINVFVELMPLDTRESFVRACCACPSVA